MGQHAECVTHQHDDVAGLVVDNAWDVHIGDKFDWVCTPCVLSDVYIIVVGH